jgi:REP element-mobilizing transposase RayT
MQGELLELGGEDDHADLLVTCHPKTAFFNLAGKLKGKSSYILRQELWPEIKTKLWGDHFWSPSYCLVSCGGAPLDIVKAYVESRQRNRILNSPKDLLLLKETTIKPGRGREQGGQNPAAVFACAKP